MDSALHTLSTGPELSSTDRSIAEEAIEALPLSDKGKRLVHQMMAQSVRMNIPDVLAIWEIGQERCNSFPGLKSSVVWMEKGNDKAGYQHMLNHAHEFRMLGINETELGEVAKAATTIGDVVGSQGGKTRVGPGRPVLLLIYKDTPLAVAISIGSNGFLVGMNRQDFDKYLSQGPPIDKLGRYQSSDGEISPGSFNFRGWAMREIPTGPKRYRVEYDYHKDGQVTKTIETEPSGEWVYHKEPVGPIDKGFHWLRKSIVTGAYEHW